MGDLLNSLAPNSMAASMHCIESVLLYNVCESSLYILILIQYCDTDGLALP